MCAIEGCIAEGKTRKGYCNKHYASLLKYGNPLQSKSCRWEGYVKTIKSCYNTACVNKILKGKYCSKCRKRIRTHGNTDANLNRNRIHTINHNFLDINSNEMYWFLGWLITDGYIYERPTQRFIAFGITDGDICQRLAEVAGSNEEPKKYLRKEGDIGKKPIFRITLYSKSIIDKCIQLGIRQNKSFTVPLVDCPDEYFGHLMRGIIEGDGSVIFSKNRLHVTINSCSKPLIDAISARINIPHRVRYYDRPNRQRIYRLSCSDKHAEKLCGLIYGDSDGIRLERKFQKYTDYLNRVKV